MAPSATITDRNCFRRLLGTWSKSAVSGCAAAAAFWLELSGQREKDGERGIEGEKEKEHQSAFRWVCLIVERKRKLSAIQLLNSPFIHLSICECASLKPVPQTTTNWNNTSIFFFTSFLVLFKVEVFTLYLNTEFNIILLNYEYETSLFIIDDQ